ncbi:MAG: serine protease [Burkholderiales bacterium]
MEGAQDVKRTVAAFASVVSSAVTLCWPALSSAQMEAFKGGGVKIVTTASGRPSKTGTGFVVGQTPGATYIITAAHVVEAADRVTVQFHPGDTVPMEGRARSIEAGNPQGLALVVVSGSAPSSVIPLPLASEAAVSGGETIAVIGHQNSVGDWGVITGTIGSRQGREIRIQAPIEQQKSGGVLLRSQRVLGLITTTLGAFANAITVRGIQDYLDGALPPGVLGSAPSIPSPPPVANPEPLPIKPAPQTPLAHSSPAPNRCSPPTKPTKSSRNATPARRWW